MGRQSRTAVCRIQQKDSGRLTLSPRGTHVFALPNTTLSGVLPAIKSSNDGPFSRVEVNEGFAGAGAVEAVANERTAILKDR
jgi:hypothetical protein